MIFQGSKSKLKDHEGDRLGKFTCRSKNDFPFQTFKFYEGHTYIYRLYGNEAKIIC